IKYILIAGVTTNNCIKATFDSNLGKEFERYVVGNCISTAGYKLLTSHLATLEYFEKKNGLIWLSQVSFSSSPFIDEDSKIKRILTIIKDTHPSCTKIRILFFKGIIGKEFDEALSIGVEVKLKKENIKLVIKEARYNYAYYACQILKILNFSVPFLILKDNYFIYEFVGDMDLRQFYFEEYHRFKNRKFIKSFAKELGKAALGAYLVGLADRGPSNLRITLTPLKIFNVDFASGFTIKDIYNLSPQRNMWKEATEVVGKVSFSHQEKVLRNFMQGFKENLIKLRREFPKIKLKIEEIGLKNTWIEEEIKKKILNVSLEELEKKITSSSLKLSPSEVQDIISQIEFYKEEVIHSEQTIVLHKRNLGFVIKIPNPYSDSYLRKLTLEGYKKTKEKLDSLAADFIMDLSLYINIAGERKKREKVIMQAKKLPLDEALSMAFNKKDWSKIKRFLKRKIELDRARAILEKGVYVHDSFITQYGVDSQDRAFLLDCGYVTDNPFETISRLRDAYYMPLKEELVQLIIRTKYQDEFIRLAQEEMEKFYKVSSGSSCLSSFSRLLKRLKDNFENIKNEYKFADSVPYEDKILILIAMTDSSFGEVLPTNCLRWAERFSTLLSGESIDKENREFVREILKDIAYINIMKSKKGEFFWTEVKFKSNPEIFVFDRLPTFYSDYIKEYPYGYFGKLNSSDKKIACFYRNSEIYTKIFPEYKADFKEHLFDGTFKQFERYFLDRGFRSSSAIFINFEISSQQLSRDLKALGFQYYKELNLKIPFDSTMGRLQIILVSEDGEYAFVVRRRVEFSYGKDIKRILLTLGEINPYVGRKGKECYDGSFLRFLIDKHNKIATMSSAEDLAIRVFIYQGRGLGFVYSL
ncbi:MAG: hypothetical protein DRP76_04255, partial [Candidatus Omnitrophota bacterium]